MKQKFSFILFILEVLFCISLIISNIIMVGHVKKMEILQDLSISPEELLMRMPAIKE
jgi:hypothetical protein